MASAVDENLIVLPRSGYAAAGAAPLDAAIAATSQRVQSIRGTAALFLGVPPEKACDLLRNVWKVSEGKAPLTDQELFVGMSMIARFGLDPIAREVYVTRDKHGRAMVIIGIDGFIKILHRTDDYDGFEVVEEWDEQHKKLLCVQTTIYSKTRSKPTVYRAYAKEYMELGGFMAGKIPWHMLRIFSLKHAARLFTPIGGSVVTEEEARWMDAYDGARPRAEPPATEPQESVHSPGYRVEPVEDAGEPAAETAPPPDEEAQILLNDLREAFANGRRVDEINNWEQSAMDDDRLAEDDKVKIHDWAEAARERIGSARGS